MDEHPLATHLSWEWRWFEDPGRQVVAVVHPSGAWVEVSTAALWTGPDAGEGGPWPDIAREMECCAQRRDGQVTLTISNSTDDAGKISYTVSSHGPCRGYSTRWVESTGALWRVGR